MLLLMPQAEIEAQTAALREEAQGLREALEAQRTELERYYVGLNAKMRKEYEQKLEELKKAQVRAYLAPAGVADTSYHRAVCSMHADFKALPVTPTAATATYMWKAMTITATASERDQWCCCNL